MPAKKRFKTKYAGVFYLQGASAQGKPEKSITSDKEFDKFILTIDMAKELSVVERLQHPIFKLAK